MNLPAAAAAVVDAYPLSRMQSGIYYHYAKHAGQALYHDVFSMHIDCEFDEQAFLSSAQAMLQAHPILRTSFDFHGFSQPLQLVHREARLRYRCIDAADCDPADLEALIQTQVQALEQDPFDLGEASLIRFTVVRRTAGEFQLLVDAHHIILDGWSMASLLTELFRRYLHTLGRLAEPVPAGLAASFKDFVRAEIAELARPERAAFWHKALADHDYRPLRFHPDAGQTGLETVRLQLGALVPRLQALAQRERVSLREVLLAAHLRLCAWLEGGTQACTTVVANGRLEVDGGDRVLGLFLNTLPLHLSLRGLSWRALIGAIRSALGQSMPHRRFPFAEMVRLQGSPISDISFNFVHFQVYRALQGAPGFRILAGEVLERTNFRLSTTFHLGLSGSLELLLTHDRSAIGSAAAARLAATYRRALETLLDEPDASCCADPMLAPEDAALLAVQAPPPCPPLPPLSLACWFERQVECVPARIALECGSTRMDYSELNARANRLARHLLGLGVGHEDIVGICAGRGIDMIVATLAVLKAGAAYLPLDPGYPASRLRYMLDDSRAVQVVCRSEFVASLLGLDVALVVLDDADTAARIAGCADDNPMAPPGLGESSLACVLYTSGSTGKPKGVMVEQRNVARLVIDANYVRLGIDTRALQLSSISFDAATFEIWGALLNGGCLVLYPHSELDYTELNAVILRQQINTMFLTPRLFDGWSDTVPALPHRLTVLVGGEGMIPRFTAQAQRASPLLDIVQVYGPTENTTFSTTYAIPHGFCEDEVIPIGIPVNGTRCHVLSEDGRPVVPGAIGQLYLNGSGVARGYLGLDGLTARSFVRSPLAESEDRDGERWYVTGDWVRQRADGNLEFVGRGDQQVKIRGFRIELGEIEAALAAIDGVATCRVRVHTAATGGKQLIAYLVPVDVAAHLQDRNWLAEVRQALGRRLPEYMLPTRYVCLEQWPLNVSGKIDVTRLPLPDETPAAVLAPAGPDERTVVEICATLLQIPAERIAADANFFELGGDSILAIQLVSRARQRGLRLSIQDLGNARDLRALAACAAARTAGDAASAGMALWLPLAGQLAAQGLPPSAGTQAVRLRANRVLTADGLRAVLDELFSRHETLRLRFGSAGAATAKPAVAGADGAAALTLADRPADDAAGIIDILADTRAALARGDGPPLRAVLLRDAPGEDSGRDLLLVAERLALDAQSWNILLNELDALCAQWPSGQALSVNREDSAPLSRWARKPDDHAPSPPPAAPRGSRRKRISDQLAGPDSAALFGAAHIPYRSRDDELLLAAAVLGMRAFMTDRTAPLRIGLEDASRAEQLGGPDYTRTLGCFARPVVVELALAGDSTPASLIPAVKRARRAAHTTHTGDCDLELRVVGPQLAWLDGDRCLSVMPLPPGDDALGGWRPDGPLCLLVDARAGTVRLELDYDPDLTGDAAARTLLDEIRQAAERLVAHCADAPRAACDLADFPLARLCTEALRAVAALPSAAAGIDDLYPATGMQQGLLFHSRLIQGAYVSQFSARLAGLDADRFREAWALAIGRHTVLRTAFVGLDSECPHQMVVAEAAAEWLLEDFRALSGSERQRAIDDHLLTVRERGFDPASAPLMRFSLLQLDEAHCLFVWSHHHALLDGWSIAPVVADVVDLYLSLQQRQGALLPAPTPYRDYVRWLAAQDMDAIGRYWRERLRGFDSPTPLPLVNPAGAGRGPRDIRVAIDILAMSPEETTRLQRFAQTARSTANVVLQAAWAILLARYSGQAQVVFGTVVSGRPAELPGVEGIAGLFINTLPVIADIDNAQPPAALVQALHARQLEAEAQASLPLWEIQQQAPRPQTLFDSLLVFENFPLDRRLEPAMRDAGLTVSDLHIASQSNYGITLKAEIGTCLRIQSEIHEDLLDAAQRAQLLRHLRQLLLQLGNQTQASVGSLTMLDAAEQQAVWKALPSELPTAPIGLLHTAFETFAERHPSRIAVDDGTRQLTYAELDRRANQLAHELLARGAGREVRIGLFVERCVDLVVGMLAILKSGSAYVPLSPDDPAARIGFIVSDAGLPIIVTHSPLRGRLPEGTTVLCIDDDDMRPRIAAQPSEPPPLDRCDAERLAYVIYTSGSTGVPKGVLVEHRQVVRLFSSTADDIGFVEQDCWVMVHSAAFDFSVWEIWGALLHGSRLVLATHAVARDVRRFAELLEQQQISVLNQTPSAFYALMQELLARPRRLALRCVVFGGEALSFPRLAAWFAEPRYAAVRLLNMYGITETTVHTTCYTVTADDVRRRDSVIGQPLRDLGVLIVDEALRLQPEGTAGELLICGGGISRGYLGRPELTAQRFIELAGPDGRQRRFYRSGDLVRRAADGTLRYLGRRDSQVKIRGYRIELGEIAAALERNAAVHAALVDVRGDEADRRLVAYVVAAQAPADPAGFAAALKLTLAQQLPAHMLPASFMLLDALPLTPNGKVDRAALAALDGSEARRDRVAPSTPTQTRLCELWCQLLKHDAIGVDDNFFEIGGHSLLAARANAHIEEAFGLAIDFQTLFHRQTVRELGDYIDEELRLEAMLDRAPAAGEDMLEI